MIRESAIVTRTEGGFAWVTTERKSACGACAVKSGCGTSVLSEVVGKKFNSLKVMNPIAAAVGDQVIVGISEQALLKGSALVYLVPLLFLFLFALFADSLVQPGNDLLSIMFGAAGFVFGFYLVRRFVNGKSHDREFQAVILDIDRKCEAVRV